MKYMAEDGRVFDDKNQCMMHEERIKQRETQKEKDYKELQKLEKEYLKAKEAYKKAEDAFVEKYSDEDGDLSGIEDLLRRLFPIF